MLRITATYITSNTNCSILSINNIKSRAIPVYLRELDLEQTERQNRIVNIFLIYWKLLKSVKLDLLTKRHDERNSFNIHI